MAFPILLKKSPLRSFLLSAMIYQISSFQSLLATPARRRSRPTFSPRELKMSSEFGQEDQVVEAIRSLCDFHEGNWKGKAKSFTILDDVAAGIVNRKSSPEYQVSVKLGLDPSTRDHTITETFHWDEKISSRSLALNGCNVDVDSVDASYSLDSAMPNIPTEISGTDKLCEFVIEHTIAASDNRRVRCFLLYGAEQNLQRIVVADEERTAGPAKTNNEQVGGDQLTARDLMEMESDIDRLVEKLTGNMEGGSGDSSNESKSSSPEPEESPLEKLGQSMSSTGGTQPLSSHDISLLELSSGVWLGDAIIRDMPNVQESPRGKGFGTSMDQQPSLSSSDDKTFGSWNVGVQKIAWRWMWNFGEEIRQVIDIGKAMGASMTKSMSKSLAGSVCVNESLSRRIPKDQRMVYVDWTGDMVGILTGSASIQAPRYLNFDDKYKKSKLFVTEFCLYQCTESSENSDGSSDEQESSLPELCCSKISRVYNVAGKFKQGVSSFYTFKRFGAEEQ